MKNNLQQRWVISPSPVRSNVEKGKQGTNVYCYMILQEMSLGLGADILQTLEIEEETGCEMPCP